MLPIPDAIIFDLDGTLVDTVPARIAAWRDAFAERGTAVPEDVLKPMIGMDGRELAREVARLHRIRLDDAEREAIDARAGTLFDQHNQDPRPLPGVTVTLARLNEAGMTWAIATSSRAEQVGTSVAALGLRGAPRIIDGSRVRRAKPAPDLLLLAARELGVEPPRCWYVGDATWDMRAAVSAGMVAIAVLAGAAVDARALTAAGASVIVDSVEQLPESG